MKNHIKVFCLLVLLLTGCNHGLVDRCLEQVLALAGENRVELEKVLTRYARDPADSLKYRAACFLIENMPGYYYHEGEGLDEHAIYFDVLGKSKKQPALILDSLNNVLGRFNPISLEQKLDTQEIDSTLLCDNIDHAFMVWEKYPWNKHTSFEDFCEFILPYRIKDERLTNWREEYHTLFAPFMEGLETDDPVVAAKHLREAILKEKGKPRFTMVRPSGYPSQDAFNAMYFNGSCDDLAQFTLFAFRSVGIPCSIDFITICGNYNLGHSWVAFRDKDGGYHAMDFFDDIGYVSDKSHTSGLRKHKAYRRTFSYNTPEIQTMEKVEKDVPSFFSSTNYRFRDVTKLYSNNYLPAVHIPPSLFYHTPHQNRIVYLCGPSWMRWRPVDWTIPGKDGEIVFHRQNIGDIVRLATYEDGRLSFLTAPFKIDEQDHSIRTYAAPGDTACITLFSKYPIEGELMYRERMVGGVFEGSNNRAFRHADTLHVIKEAPARLITRVELSHGKPYRYVRYKGAASSYCNVAEVQFFSDTVYLSGEATGTPRSPLGDDTHGYANVFDGLTETSFYHNTPGDGWAGLDLGSPRAITALTYTPRNQDNYIEQGQRYELFVSGESGWESLGIQVAGFDSLRYDGVPTGGLYYLKNHSSGMEERIFIMEDGKQVFK